MQGTAEAIQGRRASSRGWRGALEDLTAALAQASDQELLLARSELVDAVAQLSSRLRSRGYTPASEALGAEDASMAEVLAEDLRCRGYAPLPEESSPHAETEEASMGRAVAEELRLAMRRRPSGVVELDGEPDGEPEEPLEASEGEDGGSEAAEQPGEGASEAAELPAEGVSEAAEQPGEAVSRAPVAAAGTPTSAAAAGAAAVEAARGEDPAAEEAAGEAEGKREGVGEEEDDKAEEEEEEEEEPEGDASGEEDEDEVEGGTVFGAKRAVEALRACLARGSTPTEQELVRLFDVDSLPDGEDMVPVETSNLGEGFEEDGPKAARALIAKCGVLEAARLVIAACDALAEGEEDGATDCLPGEVPPPAKRPRVGE